MLPRRSRTVALCSLANLINAADRVIMPIAIIPMSEEYRWNLHWQGWILSAFAIGFITSQLLGARAASCHSNKAVMTCAVLLWSTSTIVTPLVASSLPLLLLSRVLLGFGEGLGLPTMFHIVAQTTPAEDRPWAFSCLITMGAVGQTTAAMICPHLAWQTTFYAFGALGLAWMLAWMVLHRDDPTLPREENKGPRISQLLCHWSLWAIYVAHFAMNWSSYLIMQWLPTYLSRELAASAGDLSLTAVPYVCNSLCASLTAGFADSLLAKKRWSLLMVRRLATCIGLLGSGLFLLCFCAVNSLWLALLTVSLSMGLLACNSVGHLGNHADVASPGYAGHSFALSNTLATLPGILCGPLTAELVTQSHGRWFPVFVLAAAVNFVGAVVYGSQSSTNQAL